MSGYPYNLLPVSCGDTSFKKSLGQVLAWKSGLNVPLLLLGPSCPLQTILLNDPAILIYSGLLHPIGWAG